MLVAFPLDAWPHLLAAMRARTRVSSAWSGKLTPRERELSTRILGELAARGPLSPDDIDDDRHGRRAWGSATLAKATLQNFFHGQVLIAQRDNNRRVYDLPARILTSATLTQPEPSARDTARWSALLKLRQRRLTTLKRAELALVGDSVQPVTLGHGPTLYLLREDLPLLRSFSDNSASESLKSEVPKLLAPLDPLIYDRRVSRQLWDFDYTWEVYTPPAKRVRGYYALPVLAGHELVGHVDPKADRERKKLRVMSRSVRRGHKVTGALDQLAAWLGLRR